MDCTPTNHGLTASFAWIRISRRICIQHIQFNTRTNQLFIQSCKWYFALGKDSKILFKVIINQNFLMCMHFSSLKLKLFWHNLTCVSIRKRVKSNRVRYVPPAFVDWFMIWKCWHLSIIWVASESCPTTFSTTSI